MKEWSDLPVELHSEIVRRCEFFDRLRLRQCSKYSRSLVDTSPYFIPRIRFHGKENRFLLVIFPGFKQEIWLEFEESDDDFIELKCTKCENEPGYDPEVISHWVPGFSGPEELAVTVLKSIVAGPRTVLGGLEVFLDEVSDVQLGCIEEALDDWTFRATTLRIDTTHRNAMPFVSRCLRKFVKEFQMHRIQIPSHTPFEMFLEDGQLELEAEERKLMSFVRGIKYRTKDGNTGDAKTGIAVIGHHYERPRCEQKLARDFLADCQLHWDITRKINTPSQLSIEHIFPDQRAEYRVTDCGMWFRHGDLNLVFENQEECQMRWACEKHADPFEHWYYKERNTVFDWFETEINTKSETIMATVNGVNPLESRLLAQDEFYPKLVEKLNLTIEEYDTTYDIDRSGDKEIWEDMRNGRYWKNKKKMKFNWGWTLLVLSILIGFISIIVSFL